MKRKLTGGRLTAVLALALATPACNSGGGSSGSSGSSASTAAPTTTTQPAATTPTGSPPISLPPTIAPTTTSSTTAPATPATIPEQITTQTGYVAIVKDGLETTVTPLLQGYQARGVGVALVPLSHVTAAGVDRPEQIRNWLIAHCHDGVKRNLLLVGSFTSIPYRTCTPSAAVGTVVCDLYYGDLDGTWDTNGNGVWGELGTDQPKFDASLRIGRIPFDDEPSVATAIQGIQNARANKGAWQDQLLLTAATILVPGDAPLAAEALKTLAFTPQGWTITTAYPAASPLQGNVVLSPTAIVTQLQQSPAALVFDISHGDTSGLMSNDPTGWANLLTNADLANFPKDRPPVLVAAACDSGDPTNGPCFGMLALQNGLAGYLGATVTVDPRSGGGAGVAAEVQMATELASGVPLGQALDDVVRDYASAGLAATQNDPAGQAEVYHEAMGAILYGDPGLQIGPKAP